MSDDEPLLRRCADECRRVIAKLDQAGLGHTLAVLHLAQAVDDLDRRSATTQGDAVFFVEGDDHVDDPAWGIAPLTTGHRDEIIRWLHGRQDLDKLSVITSANQVLWARQYLQSDRV